MNDVGEVILETEGELHDSQKELKLEDQEGDQKVLSQKNSQENLISPDGKSTKKLSTAVLSARNRKLSCNQSSRSKVSKISSAISKVLQQNLRQNDVFDAKSAVSHKSSLSHEQKRNDKSLNILTKKALNQTLENKGEELYPDKASNSMVGVNHFATL